MNDEALKDPEVMISDNLSDADSSRSLRFRALTCRLIESHASLIAEVAAVPFAGYRVAGKLTTWKSDPVIRVLFAILSVTVISR